MAQNLFRHFKEGDKTWRQIKVRETFCCGISGLAWNGWTAKHKHLHIINRTWAFTKHHRHSLVNRRYWEVPHELTNEQTLQHMNICKLLANSQDAHFWHWIVIRDDKLIYFHNSNKRNQWFNSDQASEPVVKQGRFEQVVFGRTLRGCCTLSLSQMVNAVNTDLYT